MPPVVLITGASSGIGYALALEYLRRGSPVAALARDLDRLTPLVEAAAALPVAAPVQLLPLAADVRDQAQMASAVQQAARQFGHLHIVVANAGIGQRGPLLTSPWEDVETLLRTNIDGVLHTLRAAYPYLDRPRASSGSLPAYAPRLVLLSSVVASMIAPYTAAYSASKAFVSSIAASLRLELERDGIAVIDVHAGRVDTAFNARRLGAAGYADRAPRIPRMTPAYVATRIADAAARPKPPRRLVLRPFDWLIVAANAFVPRLVGRRALAQYRTD